ncbi:Rv2175c family DNA-binding protein [soil metagenome]
MKDDDIAWLPLPDVATVLDVPLTKVRQLIRERKLIGVRTGGVLRVPAHFLDGRAIVKHLPGVLTVLFDGGYTDDEAIRWLFTAENTLPGTPIQALRDNRGTEVKRRAQASAL